ncbi:hypothetical protein ACFL6O_00385 [candidate division KSB1 bacterium]
MLTWTYRGIIIVVVISLLLAAGCGFPKKPELRGEGTLAVQIDSDKLMIPEYHNPLETWKPRHMQSIQQKEFTERECMSCHQVEISCNNCHAYVGVPEVKEYSPEGFVPGEDRTKHAVNGTTAKE